MLEIKKPEMTKNISTPIKPPVSHLGKAWKPTTDKTAIARRPSMSGRYAMCVRRGGLGCLERLSVFAIRVTTLSVPFQSGQPRETGAGAHHPLQIGPLTVQLASKAEQQRYCLQKNSQGDNRRGRTGALRRHEQKKPAGYCSRFNNRVKQEGSIGRATKEDEDTSQSYLSMLRSII